MKRLIVVMSVLGLIATACNGGGNTSATRPTNLPRSDPNAVLKASPASSPTHRPTPKPSPIPTSPSPKPSPTKPRGLPASLVGTEWTVLPTSKKVVALTFDAGANDAEVASILATLAAQGVPATFFLTGRWAELYLDEARDIASRYPVGNHTYDHPYLTQLSDDAVRTEISKAGTAIESATGHDCRPLFRFPFGDSNARVIGIANSLGYGGIRWTVDTLGWKGTSDGESVDDVVARVVAGLQPGEIVLMHVGSNPDDGSTLDADALPRIIEALRARGYGFVTLDQYV